MKLPENDFQILKLTETFYRAYPNPPYTEILKNSAQSTMHRSGLDYTKIVIIAQNEYIDRIDALVDKDEYNETFQRRYHYSPLKYFHHELEI